MSQSLKFTNNVYFDSGTIEIGVNQTLSDCAINKDMAVVGSKSYGSTTNTTWTLATVTFNKEFPSPPKVYTQLLCQSSSTSKLGLVNCYARNVTTTGFTFAIATTSSTNYSYKGNWLAVL